jgi:hypothetical protein
MFDIAFLNILLQPTLEQALTSILMEAWLPVPPQLFTLSFGNTV